MLNGVSPIILFYFYNEESSLLDGFPVPIYLDENVLGIGQIKEDKNINFETEWVGNKFFTKHQSNSVSLSYVGGERSSGIVLLINFLTKIIKQVNTEDREKIGYSISYYSPSVIIEDGYLASYSQSSSNQGNRIDFSFTIEKALNNTQNEEKTSIITIDASADNLVLTNTGVLPV